MMMHFVNWDIVDRCQKAMDDLSVRITGPGVEPNAYLRRRRMNLMCFLIMEELDNITENQQRL